ncbi:MAG: glycosyl hydrolase 2 galactose-binding domain-containing protein, partial [Halanaerobiales bacterium]
VQLDLMKAGLLKDPNIGFNAMEGEWVNNREWMYKKEFCVPADLRGEKYLLNFEGLDYSGEIYLNGEKLCEFEGMFLPVYVEVTDKLKLDEKNVLIVLFHQSPEVDGQYGYSSQIRTLKSRFNYIWDWCTRIVPVGIWKSVYLEAVDLVRCIDFWPRANLNEDNKLRNTVEINNPVTEEHTIMRTTLLPSLLENISLNVNRGVENINIFELNTVFSPQKDSKLPEERKKLTFAVMKNNLNDKWDLKAPGFFYLKGIIQDYCDQLGIKDLEFTAGNFSTLHPGRTAEIKINGEFSGYLGELHPDVQENYEIEERVTVCELDFADIVEAASSNREYHPLPKYPALSRDIALVVEEEVTSKEIKDIILEVGSEIIESIELFDLYQGEQLEEGDKSLAYSIKYRVSDKTLTDDEVNEVQSEIEEKLNEKLGAHIRR